MASRLVSIVRTEIVDELERLAVPPDVSVEVEQVLLDPPAPPHGYRHVRGPGLRFLLRTSFPEPVRVERRLHLQMTTTQGATFLRVVVEPESAAAEVRFEDVYPELRTAAELRLRTWSRSVVGVLLDQLADRVDDARRRWS